MAVVGASLAVLAAPTLASAEASRPVGVPATPAEVACAEPSAARTDHGGFHHDTATTTTAVKEEVAREIAAQTRALRASSARSGSAPAPGTPGAEVDPLPATITVPVRVHVIRGSHKGDRVVTRQQARQMFYQLRAGFRGDQNPAMTPTGITFDLRGVTVNRDDRWFHAAPGTPADKQMRRTLHQGSRETLNIYLKAPASRDGALLGIARFPWLAGPYPKLDGVTINVATLAGGRARGYNLGDTVIHEVGHWFGLFHTFEGGCEAPGDYVADTAPEAEPSFACQRGRDTCPTPLPEDWEQGDPLPEPVRDPVQNFMDYSYDRCMNHFTPGQRTRAVTLFLRYRDGR